MNTIIKMVFGSSLYGTSTVNSDVDIKGIYLPTAREIVLGNYKKTINKSRSKDACERNTKDDVDQEYFSLDRFLELLMEGQTVALDMMFGTNPLFPMDSQRGFEWPGVEIWKKINDNKERLLTRNVNSFVGYARMQAAKYGIKGSRMDALKRTKSVLDDMYAYDPYQKLDYFPGAIENLVKETKELISLEKLPLIEVVMLKGPKGAIDAPHLRVNGRSIPFHAKVKYAKEVVEKMLDGYGQRANKAHLAGGVDWKALSHAVRVNTEALELLRDGKITFPRPDRELLLQIKLGQLPYEQVAGLIEQGLADLYVAHEMSTLRDKPDQEWASNFIYDIYSGIVKDWI
jgi:hypothetical protein